MKASAIVCSILAGTLGVSSLALAQDGRRGDRDRGDRAEQRQDRGERREHRLERRDDRRDARQDRREWRAERRDDRRDDRREDRAYRQGYNAGYHTQPSYNHSQPRYVYNQPSYVYSQPGYRSHAPRFQRGAYLPHEYRNRGHYVNDWRSHRGLYAPPYGHQWVQVDNDFLLVALATGLIANLLVQ